MEPSSPTPTLPTILSDVAGSRPEHVAVRFEGRSVLYGELLVEARRVAKGLIGAGVVKGARVALLMANRPEWITAAFGVWMVGGVLVPISTFAKPSERDYILRH